MADIFISYAREDLARVVPLVKLFEAQGWSVWWDRELIAGSAYERVIDEAVSAARCVVVVWSRASVDSEWVQAEAGDGLDRRILVPVLFDDVRVPISFRRKHAARLLSWPGGRDGDEIDHLLRGIRACVAGEMLSATSEEKSPAAAARVPSLPRRRWLIATALASVAIVVGLALLASKVVRLNEASDARAPSEPAIAVLPFEGVSQFPVEAQLGFEIAESLRRLPGLRVLSEEALEQNSGGGDVRSIGRALSVDFVVSGRLDAANGSNRLQLDLLNTLNGGKLWTETFATDPDDLSRIAGSVADRVQHALRLAPAQSNGHRDVSSDAYLAYLGGQAALRQPVTSAATRASAIQEFQRATAADARFSLAYAGLCRAYLGEFEQTLDAGAFENAERNCHRAQTLDESSSPVFTALGALYEASGQYDQALENFQRALKLTPFDADALRGQGRTYTQMGLVPQAEKTYRTVIHVEPTYWENYRLLGGLYFKVARYTDAAEQYRQEAQFNPDKVASLNNLGSAHFMAGDFDAAIADWTRSVELDADAGALSNLGSAQFFSGHFVKAGQTYERALAMKPNSHAFSGNAGEAYYFAGDVRAAGFYARAAELAERQLAINPDDYALLSSKACYDAALGNAEKAVAGIQRAIKLNATDVYTWYDAARVYVRLNRPDDAVIAIRHALELGYSRHLVDADANFASIKKSIGAKVK